MPVTPECYVVDIEKNKAFFVEVLGFAIQYERPKEAFAYLSFQGSALMLEELSANSRKWLTGEMLVPFGRGVNFQWDVKGVAALYARVKLFAPESIFLPLEQKTYVRKCDNITTIQFIVQSPDGYLFRFCEDMQTVPIK